MRKFEEAVTRLYREGVMRGLAHLYIGQEAVAAGACANLSPDDYITSAHRGHCHCLAKGGNPRLMMAEILGRKTGYYKGKGGSTHIFEPSLGILGANGIVGGGIPLATGAGKSIQIRKTDQVVVCFFGDAATITYEAFDYLDAPIERVCARDFPIPYSEPLENAIIPTKDEIRRRILTMLEPLRD